MSPGVMSGGSDSGAILAAMDVGVTPACPAGLPRLGFGSNDNGVHMQQHALAKIHDKKASPVAYIIDRLWRFSKKCYSVGSDDGNIWAKNKDATY